MLLESLARPTQTGLSHAYVSALQDWIISSGTNQSAALYEGGNAQGGFAVPVSVSGKVVPFAPPDSAIRRLATVVPTTSDLLFPTVTASVTTALKAESGAASNNFATGAPTLGQFRLSAFAVGVEEVVSYELAQDVSGLFTFLTQDAGLSLNTLEEGLFLGGSGAGQPQAILGNVGPGVTGVVADANGFLLTVSSTYDVLDTLKEAYHPGASWLMQRTTAVQLRKAQEATGGPSIFSRIGGQDFLHGYPVAYSSAMPAIAAGATPVLFGDFALGYMISQRGDPGVYVKVLDQALSASSQPLALSAQVALLIYRRLDGRVRRSEAIQGITLHA